MIALLSNNRFRYACSIFTAVCISLVVGFYQSKYSMLLIPLVAVFVMQASIGNALYHGVQKSFLLICLLIVFALMLHSRKNVFYAGIQDILFGTAIGIAANILILPRRADIAFREKIEPVMDIFREYFSNCVNSILYKAELMNNRKMEVVLQKLPGWVHETGFDAGLRQGYQFFLVKLEQLADILFAIHGLARHDYEEELLKTIREPLENCRVLADTFFASIIQVLQLKKLHEGVEDFVKEIDVLEKQFFSIAPNNLELLDFKADFVNFAEFIYCLRDLRSFMVRLGEALR